MLLPDSGHAGLNAALEQLLMFLWDIGLEVGHSVRTVEDCIEQSLADISVITNLMESRRLAGSEELYRRMQQATAPDRIWNSREFFEAKQAEQRRRHHKYHNTAYKLEPNVKESPGGLRDIQNITWVANRHFGTGSLEELVEHGFLNAAEYRALAEGRNFLWEVRFALHSLSGRENPWVSSKNDLLLLLDILTGLGLVYLGIRGGLWIPSVWFSFLVLLAIITHLFRDVEYLIGMENPFCANKSLFLFNNLKLVALAVIAVGGYLGG